MPKPKLQSTVSKASTASTLSTAPVAPIAPAPAPAAEFIPVGRMTPEQPPRELAELVQRAWAAKLKADIAAKAYDALKTELKKALVPGDVVTLKGCCKVAYLPRTTWSITNVIRLEDALGQQRFLDLVDITTTYKPTDKLVALQDDPREANRDIIASCLVDNTTHYLDLREAKA